MAIIHKHYLWLDVYGADSWFSSYSLVQSLKKCYREKLGSSFFTLSLPLDQDQLQDFMIANQITSVILADPRVNISPVLAYLKTASKCELEFLIHIIGSPARKLEELKKINIDRYNVCLLAGSRSNYEILKNYSDGAVKYFPFLPDLINPMTLHKKNNNKFIYVGRISFQKNVLELIDLFSQYQEKMNPEAELSIYGGVCNANFPTKPSGHYIGMTAERFFLKLSELQSKGHKINYYGLVERDELLQALKDHKTFVSLSTADDEDFGMGLFEALNYGLNCVVSKWGGYREFETIDQVDLIPIVHQNSTLYINPGLFFEALNKHKNEFTEKLDKWMASRKKTIESLDLNFDYMKHNIKLELKFNTKEFFNEQQDFVSPYWR